MTEKNSLTGWKSERCREFIKNLSAGEIKVIGAVAMVLLSAAGSFALFVLDMRADLDHIIDEFGQLREALREFFADRFDGSPR